MICAIADIESSRQPLAYRFEPKLGEASTGLMQTLQSTADWLATYIITPLSSCYILQKIFWLRYTKIEVLVKQHSEIV